MSEMYMEVGTEHNNKPDWGSNFFWGSKNLKFYKSQNSSRNHTKGFVKPKKKKKNWKSKCWRLGFQNQEPDNTGQNLTVYIYIPYFTCIHNNMGIVVPTSDTKSYMLGTSS